MTYYRKLRMESFKKAMFASRYNDKYLQPTLPQRGTASPMSPLMAVAPRPLAS